ncbi:cytochrome P450 [Streptomyces sp. NPDC090088]|uniref:cytochrome P450 n=1 Tax=Streptomyces sp. NPDC090088 TaxID=3365944 RepID=UPI00382962F2
MTRTAEDIFCVDRPELYDAETSGPLLARMRRDFPVLRYERANVWVLSRYDDIKSALSSRTQYSSAKGTFLNDAMNSAGLDGESVANSFFPDGAEFVLTLDPPRHGDVRKLMTPAFAARVIAAMEPDVRAVCRQIISKIEPGEPLDFIRDAARLLPIHVVSQLLGIPPAEIDVDRLQLWSDELMKSGAALSREEFDIARANTMDMRRYFLDLVNRKRAAPGGDDLLSTLTEAQLDSKPLSEANILMLAMTTLVAGNTTTRALVAGSIFNFATHPEQAALLVEDLGLARQTVEETLRYTPALPGFMRTAAEDVQVRGQRIAAGDFVYLLLFAGNRDEQYWTDGDRFDISRPAKPAVLTFGHGAHLCIGAALARLEARCFLEELFARFKGVRFAGAPKRYASFLEYTWTSLPVVFDAR